MAEVDPTGPGAPPARAVVLRAAVTPAMRAVNVAVGTVVCALIGAMLGLAFGARRAVWGAVIGAAIALAGGLARRARRGELRPESIEVDRAARVAWIVLDNGDERSVRADDVARVRVVCEGGDEDVAAAWSVRLERREGDALTLRAGDALEARRIATELATELGVETV